MEYRIVTAATPDELEISVKENLDHKWELQGGVAAVIRAFTIYDDNGNNDNTVIEYMQAMIRK